jgi:hypothetical protein
MFGWVYQTHAAVGTDLHSPAVGDGVGCKRSGAVPFWQGEQTGACQIGGGKHRAAEHYGAVWELQVPWWAEPRYNNRAVRYQHVVARAERRAACQVTQAAV